MYGPASQGAAIQGQDTDRSLECRSGTYTYKVVLLPFLSLYSHLGPKEDFARTTINPFSHNDHLCQK